MASKKNGWVHTDYLNSVFKSKLTGVLTRSQVISRI